MGPVQLPALLRPRRASTGTITHQAPNTDLLRDLAKLGITPKGPYRPRKPNPSSSSAIHKQNVRKVLHLLIVIPPTPTAHLDTATNTPLPPLITTPYLGPPAAHDNPHTRKAFCQPQFAAALDYALNRKKKSYRARRPMPWCRVFGLHLAPIYLGPDWELFAEEDDAEDAVAMAEVQKMLDARGRA